jgi:ribosomal-protein-alanine N-acetyltransferase
MNGKAWLSTERFSLRPLSEADATPRYLSWLHQAAGGPIQSARSDYTLTQLRAYIASRVDRDDVLFLGIFLHADGQHIGNLKFEPIARDKGEAVMGILIGETNWRGKGVAPEVLPPSCDALGRSHALRQVSLGVAADHAAAQAAYRRAGFALGLSELVNVEPGHMVLVRPCAG